MSGASAGVLVATSTFAQLLAGWTAVLPIGALALYGWFRGAFLATIAALQVLAAFLAAAACAGPVSMLVESLGCPAAQSLAVAYVVVFAAVLVGIRLAVGAWVPDGACRLAPLVDQFAGLVLGVVAGLMLGGALLVGWSMADMPAWLRLETAAQPLDSGGQMLRTLARFAGRGATPWRLLLDGDRPAPPDAAGTVIRASEPYADTNGNRVWDGGPTGEPYLDVDRDGSFTRDLGWLDAAGDGRRTPGLGDCYRLADWRRVRAMHAPRIESPDTAEVVENTPVTEPVYEARASDVDGDPVTFAVEPVAGNAEGGEDGEDGVAAATAPGVAIDAATGVVTLDAPADFERAKRYEFVVVATDATGQTARQVVRLRVRDVPLEPAPAKP